VSELFLTDRVAEAKGKNGQLINAKWLCVTGTDGIRFLDTPTKMKGMRLRCGSNWIDVHLTENGLGFP
jgi:hypothetical protein